MSRLTSQDSGGDALQSRNFRFSSTSFLGSQEIITGSLSETDPRDPGRGDRLVDNYRLVEVTKGQQVHIQLNSSEFDTLLQVVNARTGRVLLTNDDTAGTDSRLTFIAQPRVDYQIRVTSFGSGETGSYTLMTDTFEPRSLRNYGFTYGYGLVDAATAIAQAVAQGSTQSARKSSKRRSPQVGSAWANDPLNITAAWSDGYLGQDVVVAVLDTGVDYRHSQLRRAIWRNAGEIPGNGIDDDRNGYVDDVRGWDFAGDDADPMDEIGHGTQVAGVLAARRKRGSIAGIAPKAKIMPVKVLGDNGEGSQDSIVAGIRYAIKNGAQVINMSLGAEPGYTLSPAFIRTLRLARRKGVAVIVAAGNERQELGATQPGEPAYYAASHNMGIAVGAVNRSNQIEDFSNPAGNRRLDFVVAPGSDIRSILPASRTQSQWWDGTSMAAPHVAGIVALMLDANPELSSRQITKILLRTARRDLVRDLSNGKK